MRAKSKPSVLHPAVAMIAFWLLLYGLYFVAPISQQPSISAEGLAFVWGMIFLYGCAALLASVPSLSAPRVREHALSALTAPLASALLVIGCLGAALVVFAKTVAVGEFSISAAAALRAERAQQMLDADAGGGLLSAIGFLTYPAGMAAMVLVLLRFESMPSPTKVLALAYGVLIFLHGLVTGGRSTLLVLIIFLLIGAYIRRLRGLHMLPRSAGLNCLLALLVLGFLVYSTMVWGVRADMSELELEAFLNHAEAVWGVAPAPRLESLMYGIGEPSLIVPIMSSVFYITQSLSIVERVLSAGELPMLWGAYHVDLIAAAMRVFPDAARFLADGYDDLLDEEIYGFFTGAWGALYIDFGMVGAAAAAVLWGWASGAAYRHARRAIESDTVVVYAYSLYAVLISFVSPPFGFANSAVTFGWFAVATILLWLGRHVWMLRAA
jgi:hypothetical protein